MWNIFQFLTTGLLAAVSPDASQIENRSCSFAGVFHVRVSSNYSLTSQQADDLCQRLFSSLATEQQIREAYNMGLDTCRYGWIADERILMLQHEIQPDCPSNVTGVIFPPDDTPESLPDAYCYDASVTSDVDCEEAKVSASVAPPSPQTAEESTAATSSPSDNAIEKATTDDSSEEDGLETKNTTVQTDTEVTPEAIEPIPEVQTPTDNPEDGKDDITMPSEITPTDGDKMAIEVPVESITGEPTTVTKEREEGVEVKPTEANSTDNSETVGTDAATTSPNDTTTDSDLELPVLEDADDALQEVNATETVDLSTTTAFAGTLEPSEVSPSDADAVARSTIAADTGTFTTTEVGPDSKEESTAVTSLDDVPEATQTPADQDVDLMADLTNENNISYGLPAPRGRMGPKDIDLYTQSTPAAQVEGGAPAWLIIFSFVMVVGILVCVFAAIATRERWYGPLRQRVAKTKSSNEDCEKRAAVSLSADKQQEMMTLMNKGQVQTNGRTEEFTVIALEEPPEKEFLA